MRRRVDPYRRLLGRAACTAALGVATLVPVRGHAQTPPPSPAAELRYVLEGVEVHGNEKTKTPVVLRFVRLQAGRVLDVTDPELELTRYRLLGTGFFSSVGLSLRKGSRRGAAVLVIDVVERQTLLVEDIWAGIAADENAVERIRLLSPYLGVQAAETNLLGTGITIGAGVGVAADQLALRTRFEDPAVLGTKWTALASVLYTNGLDYFGTKDVIVSSTVPAQRGVDDYAVVAYQRAGATVGTGHELGLATSFSLEYHLEEIDAKVPIAASELRGATRQPVDFSIQPGTTILSTLRGSFAYDTRDLPFLTTRGTLATVRLTAGLVPLGSDYGYARAEIAYDRWFSLPWGHVVRASGFVGAIAGDAPFFERFYIGDLTDLLPDRVLELAPDRRRAPNLLGTDIEQVRYGDFASRIAGEYRVPLYAGKRSIFAIDLFASAGVYAVAARRDLTDPPSGYTGFARVPMDLTYNLGLRVDTSAGGATLAFSNLLGLLPTHGPGSK